MLILPQRCDLFIRPPPPKDSVPSALCASATLQDEKNYCLTVAQEDVPQMGANQVQIVYSRTVREDVAKTFHHW